MPVIAVTPLAPRVQLHRSAADGRPDPASLRVARLGTSPRLRHTFFPCACACAWRVRVPGRSSIR
jgi:hypothetical protein